MANEGRFGSEVVMDDPERAVAVSCLNSDIQFMQVPGQVTVTNGHLQTFVSRPLSAHARHSAIRTNLLKADNRGCD
jgi:hypothetical protein